MSESRHRHFKNKGRDQAEMRRRRTEVSVVLRKNKRDDQMLKRRSIPADIQTSGAVMHLPEVSPHTLQKLVLQTQSANYEERLGAVQTVRKILSKGRHPPIDLLINAGLAPILVNCLQVEDPTLQLEAAWALTNIASGNSEQTQTVVTCGAVPILIRLLSSPHPSVCEQAVWALGNIAGDGAQCRDYVISEGIILPLLQLIQEATPESLLKNVTWTISNLCRNKNPPPPFQSVAITLPALVELVQHKISDVQCDACWALSFLADGNSQQIQDVILSGVVPKLIPLLTLSESKIVMPALRTLGNIVTGTDEQTQVVLDHGILASLLRLLYHQKYSIVREAVWTLSNITAGNQSQVQMVIDNGLIPPLIQVLTTGDFKTQKEAAWAISNLTVGGNCEQVNCVVRHGCIGPMCALLICQDATVIQVILDGLGNILKMAGPDARMIADAIDEAGGLDKIENLQTHENVDIYKLAYAIIDKYFPDEDEEDTTVTPQAGQQAYAFESSEMPKGGFNF